MNITPELLLEALTGKLPGSDIGELTGELRALSASSVLSIATQGGIRIEGDGNIVGDNNTSIVVKGEGAAELARVFRETLERGRMLFQLRPPVADFVGREQEIATLTSALRGGKHAGISGMGGTGKTELALVVAGSVRESYPDAQLLINLRGSALHPRPVEDALAACIRSLVGPEVKLPDEMDELSQIYTSRLDGKRALIVLDNAADNSQIRPFQPPKGCALVVTSRLALTLSGMTRVSVDQLQPVEARTLLVGIAPHTTAEVADQICLLCGYLPLAIRAAGSLLSVTIDLDPADYVEQLRNERTRLERIGTEDVDLGLEASFGLSYERLEPEAAGVFSKLAVFPASFDAAAEEEICADDNHVHLSELLRRSLVLYDTMAKRYRLHDLVRLFADARLSAEEKAEVESLHASYYQTVLAESERLYLQGGETLRSGLSLFDLERRNIEAGHAWVEAAAPEDDDAAYLCIGYTVTGGHVVSLRLHPREWIHWLEVMLGASRQLKRPVYEAYALRNLGITYTALGETTRAIEFLEQALVIDRETGERSKEGADLGNLGLAYAALGETRRAIEYHEQALAIDRETDDRRAEGSTLGNLGIAYGSLGESQRAIECLEQSLLIDREMGNLRGEGADLGNLGLVYANLGETERAIELHQEHLAIAREIGDRDAEGNALVGLGNNYVTVGQTRRAIEFYEQGLVIDRDRGDRRGEAIALGNLGMAYGNLGEHKRAIEFYESALLIDRETKDRGGESTQLVNLGRDYANLGETERAMELYEQALLIFRELGNRRGESATLHNLGVAYWNLGENSRAIELYEQGLAIARELGNRRGEGAVLADLGIAYANLDETKRAVDLYEQSLDIAREIGDRRGEGMALGNLGAACVDSGESRQAIEFLEQQLVIVREIGDTRREGYALFNKSLALDDLGERAQAMTEAEEALRIFEQIEGPNAAQVREQLAEWRSEEAENASE